MSNRNPHAEIEETENTKEELSPKINELNVQRNKLRKKKRAFERQQRTLEQKASRLKSQTKQMENQIEVLESEARQIRKQNNMPETQEDKEFIIRKEMDKLSLRLEELTDRQQVLDKGRLSEEGQNDGAAGQMKPFYSAENWTPTWRSDP